MKLGVFTCLLQNLPLEEALKYFKSLGIEMIELGCGGFPGNAHCDPETLLNDEDKFNEFVATIKKYDMEISALSCHGNPFIPTRKRLPHLTKRFATRFFLPKSSAFIRLTHSPAAPVTAPNQSIQTGLYARGRMISARF